MNNINICDYLKAVVKNTVKHYARDYKIDEARIKRTAKEVAKTGRHQTFLWFARECGTYSCLKAIQLAAWRNFNGAILPQLDAAARILGVEYEKVDRGE